MRIHASGVGKTLEAAMVKVRSDLSGASLHLHEIEADKAVHLVDGKAVPDPEKYRTTNPRAAELEAAVTALGAKISAPAGYVYRVLVNASDDGPHAHVRIEVDLIRE